MTVLRPSVAAFEDRACNLEDRHATRVYAAGTGAAVLFVGASLGAVAGWLSAAAYLLSAAASSGLLIAVIKLGHDRSPARRVRRRRATRLPQPIPLPPIPIPPVVSNTAATAANMPPPRPAKHADTPLEEEENSSVAALV